MDGNIASLIAQLGFPIVMCVYMMYYNHKSNDKHMDQINELNAQHKEEMREITNALNNNTLALQKLTDILVKDNLL